MRGGDRYAREPRRGGAPLSAAAAARAYYPADGVEVYAHPHTRARVEQAIVAFGAGTAGAHVSREAIRQFRALVGWRIDRALQAEQANGPSSFEAKWRHVLQCYRAVGQLAAFGKATVSGADVAFAWNAAMDKEHAEGGRTDFCADDPPGY